MSDKIQRRTSGSRTAGVVTVLAVVVLAAVVFSLLRGSTDDNALIPRAVPNPTATSVPVTPPPTEAADAQSGNEQLDGSSAPPLSGPVFVDERQLGAYVVAKPTAGIQRDSPSLGEGAPLRDIAVYDEPLGPRRALLDVNAVDGVLNPVALTNFGEQGGALVLRVIEGRPDDEWIKVQAPSRPHDRYVWVKASDFDFWFSPHRIEIDLAANGNLTLFELEQEVFSTWIVHGRQGRETPTHLTYIEGGVEGRSAGPAYGTAVLSMASYSEVLGTFGGGGMPSNYLHGTNRPDLMGQALSSGEIRIRDESLDYIINRIRPGTPVLIFDSSDNQNDRDAILARPVLPAQTVSFADGATSIRDSIALLTPKLWGLCSFDPGRWQPCLSRASRANGLELRPDETRFVVAKADAGVDVSVTEDEHEARSARVIPVHDHPGSEPRTLVYRNAIDGTSVDYPLMAQTVFGEPLVLSIVQGVPGDDWLLVRAPVLPHGQAVWVEAKYFDFDETSVHVEIDVGYDLVGRSGIMTVWDNGQEVMAAPISSGREARPTSLTASWIDQIIDGATLSPAYGPWVISTPSYSETLGSFGGGGMPQQGIHGVQDEVLQPGVPSSSGSIHVSYETIERMVKIPGLVGAPVYFFDSSRPETSLNSVRNERSVPAETRPQSQSSLVQPIGSFT